MKQLLAFFTFILLPFLISSCGCDIECTDCKDLDEENCECIVDLACQCFDGIRNGTEIGTDFGSDCVDFFECTTDHCSNLSGGTSSGHGTSKKWMLVEPNAGAFEGWKEEFSSNGEYSILYQGETGHGYWRFNSAASPTTILVILDPGRCPAGWSSFTGTIAQYPLVRLSSDTLSRRHWNSGVTMTAVPE